MNECHGADALLTILKGVQGLGVLHVVGLQLEQTGHHLHVVLDAMMNLPQERVLLPERNGNALGGFLAVGDVAGDFRDAHDLAGGVFDRGDRDGHVNEASVFALAAGLEVGDALAALNAGHQLLFLLHPVGRNQQHERLSHDLRGGVTQQPRGRGIPTGDHPIERRANNGVI